MIASMRTALIWVAIAILGLNVAFVAMATMVTIVGGVARRVARKRG